MIQVQVAVDSQDNRIIFALPDTYKISLGRVYTSIVHRLFLIEPSMTHIIRSNRCLYTRFHDNHIIETLEPPTDQQALWYEKYSAIDKLNVMINSLRFMGTSNLIDQDQVYSLKKDQAKKVLKGDLSDCKMIEAEAQSKNLSLHDVASLVMISSTDRESFLERSEIIRIDLQSKILAANSTSQVNDAINNVGSEYFLLA